MKREINNHREKMIATYINEYRNSGKSFLRYIQHGFGTIGLVEVCGRDSALIKSTIKQMTTGSNVYKWIKKCEAVKNDRYFINDKRR